MPADALLAPLPYVEAFTVAQTVVRLGMPPGMPGVHVVRRSAGIMLGSIWPRLRRAFPPAAQSNRPLYAQTLPLPAVQQACPRLIRPPSFVGPRAGRRK